MEKSEKLWSRNFVLIIVINFLVFMNHIMLLSTFPFYMGEELYELCPTEKDCLFVPGARHVESMHVDPEGYAEKLDGFIKRYIK